jgi:hypothetical protein
VLFNQPIQTSVSPTYPVFPRSIEANAVLYELAGRGTPEVHGKMDLSKHMRFQSVRLVGAVGIEPTTFGLKGRFRQISQDCSARIPASYTKDRKLPRESL